RTERGVAEVLRSDADSCSNRAGFDVAVGSRHGKRNAGAKGRPSYRRIISQSNGNGLGVRRARGGGSRGGRVHRSGRNQGPLELAPYWRGGKEGERRKSEGAESCA